MLLTLSVFWTSNYKLFFLLFQQSVGSTMKPLTWGPGYGSVLLGQSYRTPHGAMIDGYVEVVE
jgi:hypothetical protein